MTYYPRMPRPDAPRKRVNVPTDEERADVLAERCADATAAFDGMAHWIGFALRNGHDDAST